MKNKTAILTTILCLAPIAMGLALYDQLPEMVPTHFDFNGVANGWSSKPMAVFGLPVVLAVLNLIFQWGIARAQKKNDRKVAPDVLMNLVYWIPGVISVTMMPMTLLIAIGKDVPMFLLLQLFLGVIFLVIGNYLPKCKMNSFVGIRIPWTYSSEENWNKTHRFGGKVWVVCGFAMIAAGVFELDWLLLAAMFAALILPCGYSYLEFRKEKGK